jgi:hypothetical protein
VAQLIFSNMLETWHLLLRSVALDAHGKTCFLDLVSNMLQWLPERRKTAKELLGDEFLDQVCRYRAEDMK